MTGARYDELFNEGYEAYFQGGDLPPRGLTAEEARVWRDGWNAAAESEGEE